MIAVECLEEMFRGRLRDMKFEGELGRVGEMVRVELLGEGGGESSSERLD